MSEFPRRIPLPKERYIRSECPSYFKLFAGEEVKLKAIQEESPMMEIAVRAMEKVGFIGRKVEGGEIVLFPKPEDEYTPLQAPIRYGLGSFSEMNEETKNE